MEGGDSILSNGSARTDGGPRGHGRDGSRDLSSRRGTVLRVLGLGLLLAWSNLAFFSKLVHYSTRNSITHLNSVYMYACLGTAVALVGVWGLWRWTSSRPASDPDSTGPGAGAAAAPFTVAWLRRATIPAARVAAALAAVSTVVLSMVEQRWFTQPWCSIFSIAAGMGFGSLCLVWAYEYASVQRRRISVELGAAFLVGAVAHVAVLHLPEALGVACCALLPVASLGLFGRGAATGPDGERAGDPSPAGTSGRVRSLDLAQARALGAYRPGRGHLARTFTALLLISLAESFERALFMSLNPTTERMANHWVLFVATAAAALLIVATTLAVAGRTQGVFVNRVLMFAMAVLFLLAPIVEGVGLAADLATMTCHFLLYLLIWSMLARMSGEYRISVVATFAPGMGVASLGCCLGTLAGSAVMSFAVPGYRALSALALCCAVLATVSFAFLLTEDVVTDITNGDDERPAGPRRFELRCREVAAEYGLSARETEVMMLAAKGRTNQRIQEELGISAGTVNTHFAHIYKKLDIHERQQMLDLVDGRTHG